MSIRAMMRELSERTGIDVDVLRSRYRRGSRGDELLSPRTGRRRGEGLVPTQTAKYPPLPVRVPQSLRYR